MIDALKRHPQCEDVYRCLVFKEIRIVYIKEPSSNIKVLSSEEEEEEEKKERRALLEQRSLCETLLKIVQKCSHLVFFFSFIDPAWSVSSPSQDFIPNDPFF